MAANNLMQVMEMTRAKKPEPFRCPSPIELLARALYGLMEPES